MAQNIVKLPYKTSSRRKVRVFKETYEDDCKLPEVVSKEHVAVVSNSTEVALIPVLRSVIGDVEVNSVNARELHKFLESKRDFSNWITDRIRQYDLREGIDFIPFNKIVEQVSGAKTLKEYILTLSVAKELSMVERNTKGKEARQYFIECERVKKELEANPITITLPSLGIHSECTNSLITLCTEASKIAGMCVAAVEEKGRVIVERDAALHDRQHTNTRVASAMNTVGVLSKMVKDLEAELGLINS